MERIDNKTLESSKVAVENAPDRYIPIESPTTGRIIGQVYRSTPQDVDTAVTSAASVYSSWSRDLTMKARANIMSKLYVLIQESAQELAELVVMESGKNISEALASVAKGNETVQYAAGLPQMCQGKLLQVSRGINCQDVLEPVGIVASIVPFNFPAMVPLWTVPIALVLGNCVILKPSEKVPMTMTRMYELFIQAGIPSGVFQIIQGDAEAVNALVDHPGIHALTFVGSSKVAEIVTRRCQTLSMPKRVLALGGAKNHLVVLEDAHVEMTASDVVASFAGCAGQRCMAASVLLLVGECANVMNAVVAKASVLTRGTEAGCVGAIIDAASHKRICHYIDTSEAAGATILVDGRSWARETAESGGYWIGPTVMLHSNPTDAALHDEIFGPVLSILRVASFQEALAIENANPFGNAASIYTSVGAHADWFTSRFTAGMIGVNVGVPVPREPFAFGGLAGSASKFGSHVDITAEGAISFFTNTRKITSKWGKVCPMATGGETQTPKAKVEDAANFAGQM